MQVVLNLCRSFLEKFLRQWTLLKYGYLHGFIKSFFKILGFNVARNTPGMGLMISRNTQSSNEFKLTQRFSVQQGRRIVRECGLGTLASGRKPTWFYYEAFERDTSDLLTNFSIKIAEKELDRYRDCRPAILVTGCGIGITSFHFEDKGFEVEGWDLLPECIDIANRLKSSFEYKSVYRVVDCLNPQPDLLRANNERFNVVTVMHWFYSALDGNYGNSLVADPLNPAVRILILKAFLTNFVQLLAPDGILILEVVDACADYRLRQEHPEMADDPEVDIYPVRYRLEDVENVASQLGLKVELAKLAITTCGHQPRCSYTLRKTSLVH
jgi:SAM-dependent methyltransferase